MRSCSGSLIKLVVFSINLLFMVFSILLMTFGGLSLKSVSAWQKLTDLSNAPFVILITAGAFLFLITFMACCGAFLENSCMLMTFAYVVGAFVLLQIGAAVVVYRSRHNVEDKIVKAGLKLVENYESDKEAKKFIDGMQYDLKCCGIRNTTDWESYQKTHQNAYPDSCCAISKVANKCIEPDFEKNCDQQVVDAINLYAGALIGIVAAFIVIQFVSMTMACCLASAIRKDYFQFV